MAREKSIISRLPSFYRSGDTLNVLYRLISVYGNLLDKGDLDLIQVMRSHFVNTADNINSKGFNTSLKGDLDRIFSLYIENLGGTSLLKQGTRREGAEGLVDDELYRNRIKGLIRVLREGASTKAGIIQIVAANLGITNASAFFQEAIDQIQVDEFIPRRTTLVNNVGISENFYLQASNRSEIELREIRIVFKDLTDAVVYDNPRIRNLTTNQVISYEGSINPGSILSIRPGPIGNLSGGIVNLDGELPNLPIGRSNWRIDVGIGLPQADFDLSLFDLSTFGEGDIQDFTLFDESSFDESVFPFEEKLIEASFIFDKIRPASFRVTIPWDIPGFTNDIILTEQSLQGMGEQGLAPSILTILSEAITNKSDELEEASKTKDAFIAFLQQELGAEFTPEVERMIFDQADFPDKFKQLDINPRNQIKFIIDKVKAAGVFSELAYQKQFREEHLMQDQLGVTVTNEEDHQTEDSLIISNDGSPFPGEEVHETSDTLILSSVFDLTTFDSLNEFS